MERPSAPSAMPCDDPAIAPAGPRSPDDPTFRAKACAFSFAAGSVVFILAILCGAVSSGGDRDGLVDAIILAIICSVTSWAATMRALSETAGAIDRVIERVSAAAHGELNFALDRQAREELPELVVAIDKLLERARASLVGFQNLAMHDPVTGLPNRLHLRREAERQLYDPAHADTQAALIFIDLDRFKPVNDTLGHALGDQLLSMVASRLCIVVAEDQSIGGGPGNNRTENAGAPTGPRPIVARLGGDEFTIFLPRVDDEEAARRIGRRALRAISEPYEIAGHSIDIGASVGVAIHTPDGSGFNGLMRHADLAMYHAKALGRGQVQLYSSSIKAWNDERLTTEKQLRRALEQGQFELHLQPQVSVGGGHVIAAEALLRWRLPNGELRMPGSFIATAEESGLIVSIGEWVVGAVARLIGSWHAQGFDMRVSMNVSPRQLERPEFFRILDEAMIAAAAPWRLLELEITESLAMRGDEQLIVQLAKLRARGVTIAIDDFGAGYSNLARLRSMPIDRLKIDRSLIADIAHSEEAATIIHAIIALSQGLGYLAIAEGVEQPAQLEQLRTMGCDVMQGYLIARPMSEAALRAWAAAHTPDNISKLRRA